MKNFDVVDILLPATPLKLLNLVTGGVGKSKTLRLWFVGFILFWRGRSTVT